MIDSCSLSTGTGLLVTDAGRMIEQGLKAEDIAEALRERTKHCHASFILDTLTFLHAGGRCSTVAALGANVLKLKPCIEVSTEDGSMNVGKNTEERLISSCEICKRQTCCLSGYRSISDLYHALRNCP